MKAEIDYKRFSEHFRKAMHRKCHGVRVVARLWGCSPTVVSNLRQGKKGASTAVFLTACMYADQQPLSYWQMNK